MPLRVFDAHVHLHGDDLARYPFRRDIEPRLAADTAAHPATADAVLRAWDACGVEMGCAVQLDYAYNTDNRYLLDAAEPRRRRISPVVVLDPTDPATPAALQSMVLAYGVSGVRFAGLPDETGAYRFLADSAREVWRAADRLGLAVVLLPVRSPDPQALPRAMRRIGELADRYRRVRIVLDHLGFPVAETAPNFGFSAEHLALAAHPNVYLKHTTFVIAQLRQGAVPVRDCVTFAAEIYGAERLLWGSAAGNNMVQFYARFPGGAALADPQRYAELLQWGLDSAADLTPAQRQAMFHDTAKAVFVAGGRPAAQ